MDAELEKYGLYMDGMSKKLRLLQPNYHQLSDALVEECSEYIKDSKEFRESSAEELQVILHLKSITIHETMQMIGKRSRMASIAEYKQHVRTKMLKDLKEKRLKLEKMKQQNEILKQIQLEQDATIQMLCRR